MAKKIRIQSEDFDTPVGDFVLDLGRGNKLVMTERNQFLEACQAQIIRELDSSSVVAEEETESEA